MQNTFKFKELRAGNFLLKRNQDGTWKVFKWQMIPYSTESTYKEIGNISIPSKKICAFMNKPHSGACNTSIHMLIKNQLGMTNY